MDWKLTLLIEVVGAGVGWFILYDAFDQAMDSSDSELRRSMSTLENLLSGMPGALIALITILALFLWPLVLGLVVAATLRRGVRATVRVAARLTRHLASRRATPAAEAAAGDQMAHRGPE